MSEKLCTLRGAGGGGGRYKETSLWTNQSPTNAFASQAVSLSDSIDNYKYIKIKFRLSTSNSTTSETVYSVENFKTYTSTTALGISGGVVGQPVASQGYVRKAIYSNSTQIQFDTAYRLAVNDANTSYLIPLEILGLNELDHGKRFDETTLWTNSAPTSNFASQTVTLNGNMSDYDFVKVTFKSGVSVDQVGEVYVPVSLFSTQSASPNYYTFPVLGAGTSNYYRGVVYSADNKILFGDCYMMNSTTKSNGRDIPLTIVGCKFR